MKIKIILTSILLVISLSVIGQNDTSSSTSFPLPDSVIDNSNIDDYQMSTDFDEVFLYKTEIQSQKLLKNLFLSGFIFMSLVVIFLFYMNNSKIKKVVELVKIQEREINLKKFEVEKLSTILNNTVDGLTIIDNKNKILWNNKSFLLLYGYEKNEVETLNIKFLSSENEEIQKLIDKCISEKTPVQFTFDFKNKNNDTIYIQRRIIPISDDKNEIENFAIIDTDYTALKLAVNK